jgi:O-antigen/teichoic acid export membrane protein
MSPSTSPKLHRDTVLNLVGHGAPVVAALIAVPALFRALGPDRFGLVALCWTIVTFAGFLDFGIGRAVTQLIASSSGRGDDDRVGRLAGTASAAATAIGLTLAGVLLLASQALAHSILQVPVWMQPETASALRILALAVPAVLLGNVLRGVLEAKQRFGRLAVIRAATGTMLLLGPVAAVQASPALGPVMWILVGVRWLALVVLWAAARRAVPVVWRAESSELAAMARLGGWMTVSMVIASLMLYADRYVVAGVLSMESVALYAAPFEVIQRIAIIPAAIMGVFFPAFSRDLAATDPSVPRLYRSSRLAIAGFLAPIAIGLAVFSRPLLTLWLGADVAAKSATVASLLAIGALVHGMIQPSFCLLQASGRPDVPARFQLVEAPVYAVYLVFFTSRFGIVGTASAWLLRVVLSLLVQSWLARRFVLRHIETPAVAP